MMSRRRGLCLLFIMLLMLVASMSPPAKGSTTSVIDDFEALDRGTKTTSGYWDSVSSNPDWFYTEFFDTSMVSEVLSSSDGCIGNYGAKFNDNDDGVQQFIDATENKTGDDLDLLFWTLDEGDQFKYSRRAEASRTFRLRIEVGLGQQLVSDAENYTGGIVTRTLDFPSDFDIWEDRDLDGGEGIVLEVFDYLESGSADACIDWIRFVYDVLSDSAREPKFDGASNDATDITGFVNGSSTTSDALIFTIPIVDDHSHIEANPKAFVVGQEGSIFDSSPTEVGSDCHTGIGNSCNYTFTLDISSLPAGVYQIDYDIRDHFYQYTSDETTTVQEYHRIRNTGTAQDSENLLWFTKTSQTTFNASITPPNNGLFPAQAIAGDLFDIRAYGDIDDFDSVNSSHDEFYITYYSYIDQEFYETGQLGDRLNRSDFTILPRAYSILGQIQFNETGIGHLAYRETYVNETLNSTIFSYYTAFSQYPIEIVNGTPKVYRTLFNPSKPFTDNNIGRVFNNQSLSFSSYITDEGYGDDTLISAEYMIDNDENTTTAMTLEPFILDFVATGLGNYTIPANMSLGDHTLSVRATDDTHGTGDWYDFDFEVVDFFPTSVQTSDLQPTFYIYQENFVKVIHQVNEAGYYRINYIVEYNNTDTNETILVRQSFDEVRDSYDIPVFEGFREAGVYSDTLSFVPMTNYPYMIIIAVQSSQDGEVWSNIAEDGTGIEVFPRSTIGGFANNNGIGKLDSFDANVSHDVPIHLDILETINAKVWFSVYHYEAGEPVFDNLDFLIGNDTDYGELNNTGSLIVNVETRPERRNTYLMTLTVQEEQQNQGGWSFNHVYYTYIYDLDSEPPDIALVDPDIDVMSQASPWNNNYGDIWLHAVTWDSEYKWQNINFTWRLDSDPYQEFRDTYFRRHSNLEVSYQHGEDYIDVSGLTNGSHTLYLRAVDSMNNERISTYPVWIDQQIINASNNETLIPPLFRRTATFMTDERGIYYHYLNDTVLEFIVLAEDISNIGLRIRSEDISGAIIDTLVYGSDIYSSSRINRLKDEVIETINIGKDLFKRWRADDWTISELDEETGEFKAMNKKSLEIGSDYSAIKVTFRDQFLNEETIQEINDTQLFLNFSDYANVVLLSTIKNGDSFYDQLEEDKPKGRAYGWMSKGDELDIHNDAQIRLLGYDFYDSGFEAGDTYEAKIVVINRDFQASTTLGKALKKIPVAGDLLGAGSPSYSKVFTESFVYGQVTVINIDLSEGEIDYSIIYKIELMILAIIVNIFAGVVYLTLTKLDLLKLRDLSKAIEPPKGKSGANIEKVTELVMFLAHFFLMAVIVAVNIFIAIFLINLYGLI